MPQLLDILVIVALVTVLVVLGFGFYSLYRGGEFARTHSNRLMRLRVAVQAAAILLLALAVWWKSQAG